MPAIMEALGPLECLLFSRHSGILSILLAWASKTDACWSMPAQPAGMPCRMPEACLQACRHAGMQACRRQPAGIPCRHLAGIPWMPAHPAGIPSKAAGIPQAASRHPGAIPQPSCWRMPAHPAGRGRTGPVPRGSDFKGSLRELKALEQTFPFGQHPSGEV